METTFRIYAIIILILEIVLIFVPLAVLGAAINWPQSLDEPASVNLPNILQQQTSVKWGYFIYLVYSVLIIPVAYIISSLAAGTTSTTTTTTRRTRGNNNNNNHDLVLQMGNGFATLSAGFRCLGIIRWLIPMPALAKIYVDESTSDELRASIEVIYDMLNNYAGSVGEVLGVGFFASLWVMCTSIVIIRDGKMPRWVGGIGFVASILLGLSLLEIMDADLGALMIANTVFIHVWWASIVGILVFRPSGVGGVVDMTNSTTDDDKSAEVLNIVGLDGIEDSLVTPEMK